MIKRKMKLLKKKMIWNFGIRKIKKGKGKR